jgi:hypothetical protein
MGWVDGVYAKTNNKLYPPRVRIGGRATDWSRSSTKHHKAQIEDANRIRCCSVSYYGVPVHVLTGVGRIRTSHVDE